MPVVDTTAILLDGSAIDPTPAEMWVSDDEEQLERKLQALTLAIIEAADAGEREEIPVYRIDTPGLVEHVAASSNAAAAMQQALVELERSGAIVALACLDRVPDGPELHHFLDLLREFIIDHRLTRVIALADAAGRDRLISANPRLVACLEVEDLNRRTRRFPIPIAVTVTASEEAGWVVAIRCKLTRPAPALDAYHYRPQTALGPRREVLDRLGIESVMQLNRQRDRDRRSETLVFTFTESAASASEGERVLEMADEAARELIGRSLEDGETADPTRMICYVNTQTDDLTRGEPHIAAVADRTPTGDRPSAGDGAEGSDASWSTESELRCPNCGAATTVVAWWIVDGRHRPDLVEGLADGTLHRVRCRACGCEFEADVPTLVWRNRPPELLFAASEAAMEEGMERVQRLGTDRVDSLRTRVPESELPQRLLPVLVPPSARGDALRRDPLADLEALRAHSAGVPESASYRYFLRSVAEFLEVDRTSAAADSCLETSTWGELRRLVEERPEVLADGTRSELEDRYAGAVAEDKDAAAAWVLEHLVALDELRAATPADARPEEEPLGPRCELVLIGSRLDMPDVTRHPDIVRDLCRRALELLDAQKYRSDWRSVMLRRGKAELEMRDLEGGRMVEQAIATFEEVLAHTPRSVGDHWLTATHNLGIAYAERYLGDPGQNIEKAIECYDAALEASAGEERPLELAQIEVNRAIAYRRRVQGARPENLELAIASYKRAIKTYEEEGELLPAAIAKCNLASAYLLRMLGDENANRETAIGLIRGALDLVESEGGDVPAAITNLTLGNALLESDADEEELEESIVRYRRAADYYGRAGREISVAFCNVSLASAYRRRRRSDHSENLEEAIRLLELALGELSYERTPMQWADASLELAIVLRDRARSAGAAKSRSSRTQAVARLREAMKVFTPEALPAKNRRAATALGETLADQGDWIGAAKAFEMAMNSAERLYAAAVLTDARDAELSESGDLYRLSTYVLARAGDLPAALSAGERGRARWLGRTMQVDALYRGLGDRLDPELRERVASALATLRDISTRERSGAGVDDVVWRDLVGQNARKATAELDELVSLTLAASGEAVPPSDEPAGMFAPDEALAHLVTTQWGSMALVAHGPHVDVVWCDQFESSTLNELIGGGHARSESAPTYAVALHLGMPVLERLLQPALEIVGDRLVRPIADVLRGLRPRTVVLVPTGNLGLLPLHAAPYSRLGGTSDLVTEFSVVYAPSGLAFRAARERAERVARDAVLLGVANPLPTERPLRYAEADVAQAARLFGASRTLVGDDATKERFMDAAREATHVQLSCHGRYDVNHPLSSYVELAGGDALTLGELLDRGGFDGVRLVFAAACQSGMARFTTIPDEALGFPSGFLYAGAAGVVTALWPVHDLPAALLTTRFYALHVEGDPVTGDPPLDPADALAAAQRWLKQATAGELADYLDAHEELGAEASDWVALARHHPEFVPFASVFHWAPYVIVGA